MIVTIGGQKGGTGKTTTAVNLTTMRVLRGHETLLFDIDEQKTATLWACSRDENETTPQIASLQKLIPSEVINKGIVIGNEIKNLMKKYKNVIIDAGGVNNEVQRGAIFYSDMTIFPVKASGYDMWTFKVINDLMGLCQSSDPLAAPKYGYILLNEVSPHPGEARNDNILLDDYLADYPYLKRLQHVLYRRKPIRIASAQGLAIVEYHDAKASAEVTAVYEEIFHEA